VESFQSQLRLAAATPAAKQQKAKKGSVLVLHYLGARGKRSSRRAPLAFNQRPREMHNFIDIRAS